MGPHHKLRAEDYLLADADLQTSRCDMRCAPSPHRSAKMKWFPGVCSNVSITEMNGVTDRTTPAEVVSAERKQGREQASPEAARDVSRNGDGGDVVVRVNGVQEFRLHMAQLVTASGYFRNLRSSSSSSSSSSGGDEMVHQPTGCQLVEIHDLPGGAEGFAISVDMCCLLSPELTALNVALVCAAADFLSMAAVVETTKDFMQTHIFSHWRSSVTFLQTYTRLGSPIDEYVETECKAVLQSACVKSFTEIKHLSAPSRYNVKQSSGALTELLVQVCSLPDVYVADIVDFLVDNDVNLNLKCRQGRGVRSWLENVLEEECKSEDAGCWILLCLSRMLMKNAPTKRPWMELSSQFWCGLLEQADLLLPLLDNPLRDRLAAVKTKLEAQIGHGLDEIDEYLRDYQFSPPTLLSLVEAFVVPLPFPPHHPSLQEIASDVDQFLWFYAAERSISTPTFLRLFRAFPAWARPSHDTVYGAMQKLLATLPTCSATEEQHAQLLSLIDQNKLSPAWPELVQEVDEPRRSRARRSSLEQGARGEEDKDGRQLQRILQKVMDVSLMLLEENAQRSREIRALQKQVGELLEGRATGTRDRDVDERGGRAVGKELCPRNGERAWETTHDCEGGDGTFETASECPSVSGRTDGHRSPPAVSADRVRVHNFTSVDVVT